MRILALRCKNIQSLKGEHEIRFDTAPLAEAGLFAITGPTGAGKSTILDVITLALFNKIPRFADSGRETVSKNEIEKAGSVISHFADEAYAELDYEVNGMRYRSKWSISRTRNNTLKDYDMSLATLPDEVYLNLKKSQVPGKNEEILNLTYDQFVRSVLLSQGQFARLLNSDEKERARLLESLTGSGIYRVIGKTVYQKATEKERELVWLRKEMEATPILGEEEVALLESRSIKLQEDIDTLTRESDLLFKAIEKHRQVVRLADIVEKASQEIAVLNQRQVDLQPVEDKIKMHERVLPLAASIAVWRNARDFILNLETEIKEGEARLTSSETTFLTQLKEAGDVTKMAITSENFSLQISLFVDRIREFDLQLKELEDRGKEKNAHIQQLLANESDPVLRHLHQMGSLDEIIREVKMLLEAIIKNEALEALSDAAISAKLDEIAGELPLLTRKLEAARQKESLLHDLTARNLASEEIRKKVTFGEQQIAEATLEVAQIKEKLVDVRSKKEALYHSKELDSYRSTLIEGKPCPLCGSLHHPFADPELESEYGRLSLLFDHLEITCKEKENLLNEKSREMAALQASLQSNESHNLQIQEQIKESNLAWPELEKAELIEKTCQEVTANAQALRRERDQRKTAAALHQILTLWDELTTLRLQYSEKATARKLLSTEKDAVGYFEQVKYQLQQLKEMVQTNRVSLDQKKVQHVEAAQRLHEISLELTNQLKVAGFDTPEGAQAHLLDTDSYESLKDELLQFTEKRKNLLAERDARLTQINELKREIATVDLPLESMQAQYDLLSESITQAREESGAIRERLNQNQQMVDSQVAKRLLIAQKEKEATPLSYLNNLIGDSEGNRYAKFAQNLSLHQLTILANRRLSRLTDRYLLVPTDIELDMRVTDLYQGGIQRTVKTLSGGETFLVSLALALSLSDMASHKVKLESLFIDEGFGTLDHETLDMAIATLEKLQAETNRTIGIISHVESLKDRIHTQIKVIKNAQGWSKLQIE